MRLEELFAYLGEKSPSGRAAEALLHAELTRLASRTIRASPEDREDVVQETAFRVFRVAALRGIRASSAEGVRAYLRVALRRGLITKLRKDPATESLGFRSGAPVIPGDAQVDVEAGADPLDPSTGEELEHLDGPEVPSADSFEKQVQAIAERLIAGKARRFRAGQRAIWAKLHAIYYLKIAHEELVLREVGPHAPAGKWKQARDRNHKNFERFREGMLELIRNDVESRRLGRAEAARLVRYIEHALMFGRGVVRRSPTVSVQPGPRSRD